MSFLLATKKTINKPNEIKTNPVIIQLDNQNMPVITSLYLNGTISYSQNNQQKL